MSLSPETSASEDLNLSNFSEFNYTSPPISTNSSTNVRVRDEELAKIEIAVLFLIFSATLIGNFIVILGIYLRRQKMSRMYYFILHLSLADLITAFFNVGSQVIMELTFPSFFGGNILCKFIKFTQILGPYSSSYVLVMTALDRYQAICYPLSNCTWTATRSKSMLGLAWTISFIFCIPQVFIFSLEYISGFPECWATFPPGAQEVYVTWYAISIFIVPLLILIFAYSCICRTIWINFNQKTKAASPFQDSSIRTNGGRDSRNVKNSVKKNENGVMKFSEVSESSGASSPERDELLVKKFKNKSNWWVTSKKTNNKRKEQNLDVDFEMTTLRNSSDGGGESSSKVKTSNGDCEEKGRKLRKFSAKNRMSDNESQPRTSSVKGISRAKIKTIKLTVTVICCYIFCSTPFITAQLWATFDPNAYQSPFYTGTTFTILTLLASLNSCVNPWIFLFFNPNLLQDFLGGFSTLARFLRPSSHNNFVQNFSGPGSSSRRTQRTIVTI